MTLWTGRVEAAVGAAYVTGTGDGALARPGSAAEIADLLRVAREVDVALGVGVTHGVALDLSRMRNVLELDETSLLVQVQAGLTAAELEVTLAARGLELAPLPAASKGRTVGALLAAPRPSEASPRAGRFTSGCAGVSGLLADGTEVATRIAPRKATGPDLMHALVGARGTTGLITSATLRVHRAGETRYHLAFRFPDAERAIDAARALMVAGARPLDLQISGTTLRIEGSGATLFTDGERALARRIAADRGGEAAPHTEAQAWQAPAYERATALEAVHQLAAELASEGASVSGWHSQGAALVDPARPPAQATVSAPLFLQLKARLDPDGRFPAWPGS